MSTFRHAVFICDIQITDDQIFWEFVKNGVFIKSNNIHSAFLGGFEKMIQIEMTLK